MTDHPSNPPSQTKGQEIAALFLGTGSGSMGHLAALIGSALAAQEARHKAELDGMREARDSWAGIAGRNAGALVEAESKLRECAARVKSLMDGSRCSGCGEMSTNCICGFRY